MKFAGRRKIHSGGPKYGKTTESRRAYFRWWRTMDRPAYNANRLAWAKDNDGKRQIIRLRSLLKKTYRMTLEDYDEILKGQGGVCAICGRRDSTRGRDGRLVIDHDHKTMDVRGLLCHSCNLGIGLLQEDVKVLARAIKYLKKCQH